MNVHGIENAGLELNGPKSHGWKMKDQRPRNISYSKETAHVVFTSSNIQKFQYEKPFIRLNAQNSGNRPT